MLWVSACPWRQILHLHQPCYPRHWLARPCGGLLLLLPGGWGLLLLLQLHLVSCGKKAHSTAVLQSAFTTGACQRAGQAWHDRTG